MIIFDWIKSKMGYAGYNKESDLKNAKKYALLSLAYWDCCDHKCDIQINIEGTTIYVRLGK